MPLALATYRALYNARCAYADTLFRIEHELAAAHFDAVAAGDTAEAAEIERLRKDLGLLD